LRTDIATSERVPVFSLRDVERDVDVVAAVRRVVASHRYILGSEVARFERAFAEFCGVDQCVAVANGTDALELALRSLDVGHDARVLVVANAGHYGSTAVRAVGAVPEYVDIDPVTLTMSPLALSAALEGRDAAARPAAIIVTHLYGQLADMDAIVGAASRLSIPVIEDCAQAHGAARDGIRAGAFATIGCFSFYPTKNLGAAGDGGALVTDDAALAGRVRSLRQYGWGDKYHVELPGGRNSRLDEIQAAVLNDRLPHLERWNRERRVIASTYRQELTGTPLVLPLSDGEDHVAHLYVVRAADRQRFRDDLAAQGIDTEVHYPVPDHLQRAYDAGDQAVELPETMAACAHVVSLPCYPGLLRDAQMRVIAAADDFFSTSGH
jgi:dTDP-4-amino-4,6-dideoxygalactose transaminase